MKQGIFFGNTNGKDYSGKAKFVNKKPRHQNLVVADNHKLCDPCFETELF